jgi:hypothetical protein
VLLGRFCDDGFDLLTYAVQVRHERVL